VERTLLQPMGIFTMLRFKRVAVGDVVQLAKAS
jgi:hypothetical protein